MFLVNTEAHLVELVGLVVQDIDLEKVGLYIRPNDIWGLKTKISVWTLPLSERCQKLANSML